MTPESLHQTDIVVGIENASVEGTGEKLSTLEKLVQNPPDCLVVFGHSVGKVGENGDWLPSQLLQPVISKDVPPAADGFVPFVRTAERGFPGYREEEAIVGGGEAVVIAGIEMYRKLRESGKTPRVIFIGGRAGYLNQAAADEEHITEAKVMEAEFMHRLAREELVDLQSERVEGTRTTEDDMNAVLEAGEKYGSVSVVGLGMRLPRAKAFLKKAMDEKEEKPEVRPIFVKAENILKERYEAAGHGEWWRSTWARFINSRGYRRTKIAEQGGIAALKRGSYGQALGGTGKT